jgi:hypothetical protein
MPCMEPSRTATARCCDHPRMNCCAWWRQLPLLQLTWSSFGGCHGFHLGSMSFRSSVLPDVKRWSSDSGVCRKWIIISDQHHCLLHDAARAAATLRIHELCCSSRSRHRALLPHGRRLLLAWLKALPQQVLQGLLCCALSAPLQLLCLCNCCASAAAVPLRLLCLCSCCASAAAVPLQLLCLCDCCASATAEPLQLPSCSRQSLQHAPQLPRPPCMTRQHTPAPRHYTSTSSCATHIDVKKGL